LTKIDILVRRRKTSDTMAAGESNQRIDGENGASALTTREMVSSYNMKPDQMTGACRKKARRRRWLDLKKLSRKEKRRKLGTECSITPEAWKEKTCEQKKIEEKQEGSAAFADFEGHPSNRRRAGIGEKEGGGRKGS